MIKKFDWKKLKANNLGGVIIVAAILVACLILSYVLVHNPHQGLHNQVFTTADKIRNFYRDEPGYWKLSLDSAKQNNLISEDLLKYTEYDIQVGEGVDGEMAMPINQTFDIVLKHVNKSACINLSEMSIPQEQMLGLQKITIINEDKATEFVWGADENPLPITKYSTRDACKAKENIIMWTFQ